MGLFDAGRRSAEQEQLDAQRVLRGLWNWRLRNTHTARSEWDSAQSMLQHFKQDEALTDSHKCSVRIKYLEIPEPQPKIEFFAPESVPPLQECPAKLAEVRSRYQREMPRYRET